MYKNSTIGVVVPCHNEENLVGRVIDTMPSIVDRIVIVDDKSSDKTADVVEEYQAKNPDRVIMIKHSLNQGVGGAIGSGYEWCRDNGIDVAVVMAGDAQMDPADLPRLIDPVVEDRVDYSKGNRLVTGDAYKKIPKVRFFGNSILSLLTKIASGYWRVADSQTGYTAINRRALKMIDWQDMYKRYGQPNDILVKLNVANLRVMDVPIRPVYNVGEVSGIKVRKVIFTISKLLVRLFFWRLKEKYIIRDFHPLVLFYLFGFFTLGLSAVFFVRMVWLLISTGGMPEITFVSWFFTFSMSFNAFLFAMWFDYETNKYLNPPMESFALKGDKLGVTSKERESEVSQSSIVQTQEQ